MAARLLHSRFQSPITAFSACAVAKCNQLVCLQEPDWTGSGIAFYGVSNAELLKLTFYHAGGLGMDSDLGEVTIEISDVRKGRDRDQRGCVRKDYDLQDADSGIVEIECLFVPEF